MTKIRYEYTCFMLPFRHKSGLAKSGQGQGVDNDAKGENATAQN